MPEYSKEDFMRYVGKVGGRKARGVLESLGKSAQFMNQLETPVGKALLSDLDEQITLLHRAVVIGGIDMGENEKREKQALLRAYLTIAERWSQKIASHEARVAEIRGAQEG